eukprot:jgi/Tetstr1/456546/TSEL_043268.t1
MRRVRSRKGKPRSSTRQLRTACERSRSEVVAEAVASEVEADAELVHNEDEEGGDDDELMAPSPAKGPQQLDEDGGRELHLDNDDDGSGGADDVSMGSVHREEGSERSIGLSDGEREMEGLQELLLQQSQERPASPEQETMEMEAEAAAEETAAEETAAEEAAAEEPDKTMLPRQQAVQHDNEKEAAVQSMVVALPGRAAQRKKSRQEAAADPEEEDQERPSKRKSGGVAASTATGGKAQDSPAPTEDDEVDKTSKPPGGEAAWAGAVDAAVRERENWRA